MSAGPCLMSKSKTSDRPAGNAVGAGKAMPCRKRGVWCAGVVAGLRGLWKRPPHRVDSAALASGSEWLCGGFAGLGAKVLVGNPVSLMLYRGLFVRPGRGGSRRRGSVHPTVADASCSSPKTILSARSPFAPTPKRRREWSVSLGGWQVARLRRQGAWAGKEKAAGAAPSTRTQK